MVIEFACHIKFEDRTIHIAKQMHEELTSVNFEVPRKRRWWTEFWQGQSKVQRAVPFAADASAEQETCSRSLVHHSEGSRDQHRLFLNGRLGDP